MLTAQDIEELVPEIGIANAKKLINDVEGEKTDMTLPNGLPLNAAETRQKQNAKGMENSFYVMKRNFNKVLDFAKIDAYGDKSKEEIKEIITQKAKHYIHKDSIDFWMKNPNPFDIKEGNDLPDFEISRRVMLEELTQ